MVIEEGSIAVCELSTTSGTIFDADVLAWNDLGNV